MSSRRPALLLAPLAWGSVGLSCGGMAAPGGGGTPWDASWKAIVVNGGADADSNWASHRIHLELMVDTLEARGLRPEAIQVLASDGSDPTPDLAVRSALPDSGEIPSWLVSTGPVFDPGGPLAHLLPPLERVDTAWTRTPVAPATRAYLEAALVAADLKSGDVLLLTTTDHGREDGALELWHEALPADAAPLAELFRGVPEGARVLTVMSQCHSGAFARPVLELRAHHDLDICGLFSVPEDRQATGCFPDRDGERVGHAFDIAAALRGAETLDEAHRDVLRRDRGPDVPLRTSDVWLWDRILDELGEEASAEDIARWVDRRGPPRSPEAEALRQAVGLSAGGLAELHVQTDRALVSLDALTLLADAHAWGVVDLSYRVQQAAMEGQGPWPARLETAVAQLGAGGGPLLAERSAAAEEALWTASVHEAVLARLGWLSVRAAGLAHFGDEPALQELLACEAARLPGRPSDVPVAAWSAPLPAPESPRWLGVQLENSPLGSQVVAVHPAGPAAGLLRPGDRILAAAGQASPLPEVVAAAVLGTEGALPFTLAGGRSVAVEPVPLPPRVRPVLPPPPGASLDGVLDWLEPPPPSGAQLVVFVGPSCPSCSAAVARSEAWAGAAGVGLSVLSDPSGRSGAGSRPDPGGFVADAFGVALYPTVVALDARAEVVWRVDGWEPGAGLDLPALP